MYISKSQRKDFKAQLKESLASLMYRVEWEKAGVEDMTYIKAADFSDAMNKFKERFPQVEEHEITSFIKEPNLIKEDIESEEEDEFKAQVPATDTSMGASQIINSLIQDELQAIDGYNSAIQTFRNMSGEYKDKLERCIKVLSDIAGEENIHVGQLQEAQKLFNEQATLAQDGAEEAKEQIEAPVEETKEEIDESVESATQTLKDKYKDPESKALIDAIISLLEEHSPEQAEKIKEIVKE